ncbi:PD40 domain-containing protein [Pleionea sediminis]|uniref:PD40 domain-containing protein n=1 Tax=Pleionea sediminis TaxID=2569479 RepID=UPI0011847A84|nr:PD40 domain-containing protein [Pleionea sediminis]
MIKTITIFFILLFAPYLIGAEIPGTDISLFEIKKHKSSFSLEFNKHWVVREGYDNQPTFTADSESIYFTRMSDDGTTDIWQAFLSDEKTSPIQITKTVESEYSPTPLGRENELSAVIAFENKQSLKRVESGELTDTLSGTIEPVGYHAWVSENDLALFRLAEPHELVWYDRKSGKSRVVAEDVGRCMIAKGNDDEFFFAQNHKGKYRLQSYSLSKQRAQPIIVLLDDSEDFAWHSEIGFIHSNGDELFISYPPYHRWDSLASGISLSNISRLSISPDGRWLAVVHNDLLNNKEDLNGESENETD